MNGSNGKNKKSNGNGSESMSTYPVIQIKGGKDGKSENMGFRVCGYCNQNIPDISDCACGGQLLHACTSELKTKNEKILLRDCATIENAEEKTLMFCYVCSKCPEIFMMKLKILEKNDTEKIQMFI